MGASHFSLVLLGHDPSYDEIEGSPFAVRLAMALNIEQASADQIAGSVPVALETDVPIEQGIALEALIKAIGGHALLARNRRRSERAPAPSPRSPPSEASTEVEMRAMTAAEVMTAAERDQADVATGDVPWDQSPTAAVDDDIIELNEIAGTMDPLPSLSGAPESILLGTGDLPGNTEYGLPDLGLPPTPVDHDSQGIPIVVGAALTGEMPVDFHEPPTVAAGFGRGPGLDDEFDDLSLPGDTHATLPALGADSTPMLDTGDLPGYTAQALPRFDSMDLPQIAPEPIPVAPPPGSPEWGVRRTSTSMKSLAMADVRGLSAEKIKRVTSAAMPVLTASALRVLTDETAMPLLEQGDADDELVLCWADDMPFLPGGGADVAQQPMAPPTRHAPMQQAAHDEAPLELAVELNDDKTCPKCGFKQSAAEICQLCGVVFAKIHRGPRPDAPERQPRGASGIDNAIGAFRKLFTS